MELDEFKDLMKIERKKIIGTHDLVFQEFKKLDIDKMEPKDVIQQVSELIIQLRNKTWSTYVPLEKEFTVNMLKTVINDDKSDELNTGNGVTAITNFIEKYSDYVYQLILSNTNSRRTRAGKEFESILELLLMACNVTIDSQGRVGKKVFSEKKLGKMVDIVVPSSIHFTINKYDTLLISAKTTLRERWQEVNEEDNRTGAAFMYLTTLDSNISKDVIDSLNEAGIRLVVLKQDKENFYKEYESIVSYETLFQTIIDVNGRWESKKISNDNLKEITDMLSKQQDKQQNNRYISAYYKNQINYFDQKKDI